MNYDSIDLRISQLEKIAESNTKTVQALTNAMARDKEAHKRLEEILKQAANNSDIKIMQKEFDIINQNLSDLREDVRGLQSDVQEIKDKPAKKYNHASTVAATTIITAAITFLVTYVFSFFIGGY